MILEPNDKSHSKDPESQIIWLVGTEGGTPRPYTPHPGRAFSPQWSPDSQALAFLSIRTETSGSQIYLMPVGGGEARQLTGHDVPVAAFLWSPGGRRIAYLVPYPHSDGEKEEREKLGYDEIELGPSQSLPLRNLNRLWTVDVSTGQAEQVQIGTKHVMDMDWSPDGSRFLLTTADSPYPDDMHLRPRLVRVSSSGGKPTLYCATLGKLRGASWSPDGKSIAFMGSLKGGADFYPGGLFHCSGPGNPTEGIELLPVEKRFKYLPPLHDIFKVIAVADLDTQDYLWAIRETMARVSEVNRLTWDDVDLEGRHIILYTRKKKGGHLTPRKVPMTEHLFKILSRRYAQRNKQVPWVFWHAYTSRKTGEKSKWPYGRRKRLMPGLCKKAGTRYFNFHALRHSGASVMDNSGVPIGSIQRILGHETRRTTEKYLQSIGESERQAMAVFEEASRKSHMDSHTEVMKGEGRSG